MKNRRELTALLDLYHSFEECVIEEIRFTDFATSVVIVLNNIWNPSGSLRENLDVKQLVTLKFVLVEEFRIFNALSETMRTHAQEMNWGFNEISMIRLEPESTSTGSLGVRNASNYVSILWENDRQIEIGFEQLHVAVGAVDDPAV